MNKERLIELADVLQGVEEHEVEGTYYQNSYFHPCGSPSCIAGWAIHTFDTINKNEIFDANITHKKAADLLGLSLAQTFDLFGGLFIYENMCKRKSDPRAFKPGIAAEMLRYFAKTGEVNWDKAEKNYLNKNKPEYEIIKETPLEKVSQ